MHFLCLQQAQPNVSTTYRLNGYEKNISTTTAKELSRIHSVLYMCQLCNYINDSTHVIKLEPLQLQEDLIYEEQPIKILDHKN